MDVATDKEMDMDIPKFGYRIQISWSDHKILLIKTRQMARKITSKQA
jgi:hypothetical protein